jgi:ribonucleoside-diphosphate reductase beta chain
MPLDAIRKRDNTFVPFDRTRIEIAISKACAAVNYADLTFIPALTDAIIADIKKKFGGRDMTPGVEDIQDYVELHLMRSGHYEVAKEYIMYRQKKIEERQRNIFKKRVNLKPYEYPELLEYVDAIRHSYWIHTEFSYTADVQDFHVNLTDKEKNAIKHAMLAIAQIEVSVKTFWGDIYKKMPKPEIGSVGATFSESEVRHQDAYSFLLELLGLNTEFETIKNVPVIMNRIQYLDEAMMHARSDDNQEYAQSVLLFSLFIEHVSLFSQFLIIMSFNKHRDKLKGISNVIEATSKEEQIHGLFGIELIKIIQTENPGWFNDEYKEKIYTLCRKAYEAEVGIIDWIFEAGELDFLPKTTIQQFIMNRFNNSLTAIGCRPIFTIDIDEVTKTDWFDDEVIATKHGDFFVKRSVNYNKRSQSITSEDLF